MGWTSERFEWEADGHQFNLRVVGQPRHVVSANVTPLDGGPWQGAAAVGFRMGFPLERNDFLTLQGAQTWAEEHLAEMLARRVEKALAAGT